MEKLKTIGKIRDYYAKSLIISFHYPYKACKKIFVKKLVN